MQCTCVTYCYCDELYYLLECTYFVMYQLLLSQYYGNIEVK